jgi:glycosyltransferase involved in cell wall biosynthesis
LFRVNPWRFSVLFRVNPWSYNARFGCMRILMIAPEPFFEPRGTPFSEFHRIRALIELGHTVDLVTYPFGRDVSMPGLRVFRTIRPPFMNGIGIGPSWRKLPLDLLVALSTMRRALSGRYDAVHSHEEASWWGVPIAALLGVPHLYDMHSSLPQQLTNFAYSRSRALTAIFRALERFVIRRSRVVIVICPQLEEVVREIDRAVPSVLIENAPGSGAEPVAGSGAAVRASLGLDADAPMVLYTGTFEPYQGLDLLLESVGVLQQTHPGACMLIVGGNDAQVAQLRERATILNVRVICTGQRPPAEIPHFVEACDILVSPRISGTNTPLKIYSYLRSGRPIVATNLLTHTQVLSDRTAVLVEPDPRAFARALGRLIDTPDERTRIAAAAAALAAARYSRDAYLTRTRQAYAQLMDGAPPVARARLVTSGIGARGPKLP